LNQNRAEKKSCPEFHAVKLRKTKTAGRHGGRLQWFDKFLRSKKLTAQNRQEAVFEQRKG
jgi:hypothetical protein